MKKVHFAVDQVTEEVDVQSLEASVKIAQTKIKSLGLEQFDSSSFSFTIGPTSVAFSSTTLPEVEADLSSEG